MCPKKQEEPYLKQPVYLFCMQHHGRLAENFQDTTFWHKARNMLTLTETPDLISSANSFAMKAKRKTLNAGDVMSAMEEMEFERFLPPLREALEGNSY